MGIFSNQRRIRQQKEGDGFCLSFAVLKIAPTVPTAIRLWETFIFTCYAKQNSESYTLYDGPNGSLFVSIVLHDSEF